MLKQRSRSKFSMSPFARHLHELRMKHGIRQGELAELIGYEQSYISAVEVGLKGPPTAEFIDRLADALNLSDSERSELHRIANASQRKLVIDVDAPKEAYLLLHDLRKHFGDLTATQIRVIRDVLQLGLGVDNPQGDSEVRRIKRRRGPDATSDGDA